MGKQSKCIAKVTELCESVNESGEGEQVGVWNRIEDELRLHKAESVGVERKELGGEIGIVG